MRIAVCDDDKRVRSILCGEIKDLLPEADVEAFATGENFLYSSMIPDILFLDVELPGKNGLKLAKELRAHGMDYDIVFVSGIEDYVWQAFDVSALHFLRKPVSVKELKQVIDRAAGRINERNKAAADDSASMVIRYKGITEKVFISDIVYAEASGRKVILHRENDSLEYYGKISDLEGMLGEDFFRIHRAYLINMKYVVKYGADEIRLKTDAVPMSKSKYPDFVRRFLRYNAKDAVRENKK